MPAVTRAVAAGLRGESVRRRVKWEITKPRSSGSKRQGQSSRSSPRRPEALRALSP